MVSGSYFLLLLVETIWGTYILFAFVVNLALALAKYGRVGLLDLDIFGPSIPKLMGLEGLGEPELTRGWLPAFEQSILSHSPWLNRWSASSTRESWAPVHVYGISYSSR